MESVNIYVIKGVSIGWPYFVHSTLVRVSMESADTLCQGVIHGLATLCMSNVGQSIHGIRRYFVPRGYPWVGHAMYVQCWSEYPWNPQILCAKGVSMGWPRYVCPTLVRVSMESADTLPRGYPWVGHAMYVQRWSEYLWNPRILCQGGIHGLAILYMYYAELEIAVGHWPFSNQFSPFGRANPIC